MQELKRLTPATVDVLRVLLDGQEPLWGLRIVKATGRPAGVIYPILDRLESIEWLTSQWEEASERSGPRRRFYKFSPQGRDAAHSACVRFTAKKPTPARLGVAAPELA